MTAPISRPQLLDSGGRGRTISCRAKNLGMRSHGHEHPTDHPRRDLLARRFRLLRARTLVLSLRPQGAKGLGPRCRLSGRAQVVHQVARRQRHADELSLKRFPFGAMTSAPDFTHRLASGMSDVTTIAPGPARSAIQSSAASVLPCPPRRRAPQSPAHAGLRSGCLHNENCQPVASRDAIDLILHRTGVGVDKDTQLWSDPLHVGAVGDQSDRIKSARSTEWMAGPSTSREPPTRAASCCARGTRGSVVISPSAQRAC